MGSLLTSPIIVMTDGDGRNVFANAAARLFFGLDPEEISGDRWIRIIHPDDQLRAAEAWLTALTAGTQYRACYRYRRYDGRFEWFRVSGFREYAEHGRGARWVIVSEPIPEPSPFDLLTAQPS